MREQRWWNAKFILKYTNISLSSVVNHPKAQWRWIQNKLWTNLSFPALYVLEEQKRLYTLFKISAWRHPWINLTLEFFFFYSLNSGIRFSLHSSSVVHGLKDHRVRHMRWESSENFLFVDSRSLSVWMYRTTWTQNNHQRPTWGFPNRIHRPSCFSHSSHKTLFQEPSHWTRSEQ